MLIGKTIQIYLPDGNPRSVKIAEVTSRTAQAVLVPRSKLDFIASRSELTTVGVYYLIGNTDNDLKPGLYIGEAEDCLSRLKQHNKGKDFWNIAITIISRTKSFNKAHIKYLEWISYEEALEVGRYRIKNTNAPTKPYITEPVEADLNDTFETAKTLVSTLGHPIFDKMRKPISDVPPQVQTGESEILICKGKDAYAEGEYTEEGLVVLKNSKCTLKETPTIPKWASNIRQKLSIEEVLIEENGVLLFQSDYIFNSPSAAAATVLGRSANGWTEWKYTNGKTLDDVKRKT